MTGVRIGDSSTDSPLAASPVRAVPTSEGADNRTGGMSSTAAPEATPPVNATGTQRRPSLMTKFGFRVKQETDRKVIIRNGGAEYCNNFIKTSKYTWQNFLPRSLFEQFRRLGNQYFLLLVILMMLGTYTDLFDSPIAPFTTLAPLIIVLSVSLAQEGYTDFKRHKSDDETNGRSAEVLNGSNDKRGTKWEDLRVGDIITVKNGNPLPADIVLLGTSEEEAICYIETSQIDGETNLKLHRAPLLLFGEGRPTVSDMERICKSLDGVIEAEPPNEFINTFIGHLKLSDKDLLPLGPENLLLRGAALRNTEWAVGVVVYAGIDTKIIRNSKRAPSKLSRIDLAINGCVRLIFLLDAILVTISAGLLLSWENTHFAGAQYLGYYENGVSDPVQLTEWGEMDWQTTKTNYVQAWLTFLILYNNFIPISMYVTVEMVVFTQLAFINNDIDIYSAKEDMPAKARSSNVTDMGQIQYVFSDKTGTLTQNEMRFKLASVDGKMYGTPIDADNLASSKNIRNSITNMETGGGMDSAADTEDVEHVIQPVSKYLPLDSLKQAAFDKDPLPSAFLDVLSLAHSVVVETKRDGSGEFTYQAESPDEEALVDAAKEMGYKLLGRNSTSITTEVNGVKQTVNMLALNKFDSDRKRMSVVIQGPDGVIRLLCKGADSSMLGPEQAANLDSPQVKTLMGHLDDFACEGLRTLVLSTKVISREEWEAWRTEYKAALEALEGREQKLTAAASKIEINMTVAGATAIEDRLQDGVPQTIKCLAEAGIKLWVLTGDKRETAINIGFSCHVLTSAMKLNQLVSGSKDDVRKQLAILYRNMVYMPRNSGGSSRIKGDFSFTETIAGWLGACGIKNEKLKTVELRDRMDERMNQYDPNPSREATDDPSPTPLEPAFIMEGPALVNLQGDPDLESMLFQVASKCNAVIACRVTPKQKATLVQMVKQYVKPTPVTLSIGDGANDVPMLQEAQVGVGISGKEGQQAVNNSDFAVARFRFLKDLLLVHGRWDYRRLSTVVLYSFFKNTVLVSGLFFYNFYSGFSGTPVYDQNFIAMYNFFLGLPIIAVGIFDKDVPRQYALDNPQLYQIGRDKTDLNAKVIASWIGYAIVCGVLVFFIPMYTLATTGRNDLWGLDAFGTIMFTALIIAMNWKVIYDSKTITYCISCFMCCGGSEKEVNGCKPGFSSKIGWTLFFWIGSIIFYFFFALVYGALPNFGWTYYGTALISFGSGILWLYTLLIPIIAIMVFIGVSFLNRHFFPTPALLAIERYYANTKKTKKTVVSGGGPT